MEQEELVVRFRPIGIVYTETTDEEIRKHNTRGKESVIEIYTEFQEGLHGLEGFSHIFVISHFDRLRPEQIGPLQVRPKGLLRYGFKLEDLPLMGVFALDSPTRPNAIGLSLVPLKRIDEGRHLVVSGLDLFDKTPVLDIKPYQSIYRVDQYKLPEWHTRLQEPAGYV